MMKINGIVVTTMPADMELKDPAENKLRKLIYAYKNSSGVQKNSFMDEIVEIHKPYITSKAYQVGKGHVMIEQDDLIAEGNKALKERVEAFDMRRIKFLSFAATRINGAMVDYVREEMKQYAGLSRLDLTLLGVMRERTKERASQNGRRCREVASNEVINELAEERIKPDVKNRERKVRNERVRLVNIIAKSRRQSLNREKYSTDSHKVVEVGATITGESSLNIDAINDCPFKDCTFPRQDHIVFQLGAFSQEEMIVLDLYYGLTSEEHKLTMKEIGELLGLSESRVSQKMSELKLKLKDHKESLKSGIPSKTTNRQLSDPLFKLIIRFSSDVGCRITGDDYNLIPKAFEFISEDERRMIKQIRGGESKFCIPPTDEKLSEMWEVSELEVAERKRVLGTKLSWFIGLEKEKENSINHSAGWILSLGAIERIFKAIDEETATPESVTKTMPISIGYKPIDDTDSDPIPINREGLIRFIENPFSEEREYTREEAFPIIHAMFAEPAGSIYGRLFREYPEAVETLLEEVSDNVAINVLSDVVSILGEPSADAEIDFETLYGSYKKQCGRDVDPLIVWNFAKDFKLPLAMA